MAFTLTVMEQFRKYRNGDQAVAHPYSIARNPVYDLIDAGRDEDCDIVNSGAFAGAAYFSGDYPEGDTFGRDVPEATHGCFCMNARVTNHIHSSTSARTLRLMSGAVQVAAVGNGGDQVPQDPTLFYKGSSLVATIGATEGGVSTTEPTLLEIYWYTHATAGVMKLFIAGNEVYSFTGNTDFNGGAGIDRLIFTSDDEGTYIYEYYMGSVTAESDMPRRQFSINQLPVNSDGLTTNWTANGAGAHYADVDDETVADSDATTITATANTAKCLFGVDDQYVPDGYTPFAVQLSAVGMRHSAAPDVCDVRPVALSNATEVSGDWSQLQTATWEFTTPFLMPLNPDGDVAWSAAALASLQIGVEVGVQL